jgi:hypothetical protein
LLIPAAAPSHRLRVQASPEEIAMRSDPLSHAPTAPKPPRRSLRQELPWIAAFAAVFVYVVFALATGIKL